MTAVKVLIWRAHTQAIGLLNEKTGTHESRARIQNTNRNRTGSPVHDQYIPQRRHLPIPFQLRYGCREIPHAKPKWLCLQEQIRRRSIWRSVTDGTPSVGYDRNWSLTENVWYGIFAVCRSTLLWLLCWFRAGCLLLETVRCLLCYLLQAFPDRLIKAVALVACFGEKMLREVLHCCGGDGGLYGGGGFCGLKTFGMVI